MEDITLTELFSFLPRASNHYYVSQNYKVTLFGKEYDVKYRVIGKSCIYSVLINYYEFTFRLLHVPLVCIFNKGNQERVIIGFNDNDGFDIPLKNYIGLPAKSANKK